MIVSDCEKREANKRHAIYVLCKFVSLILCGMRKIIVGKKRKKIARKVYSASTLVQYTENTVYIHHD